MLAASCKSATLRHPSRDGGEVNPADSLNCAGGNGQDLKKREQVRYGGYGVGARSAALKRAGDL